jgi:hypothetical protein
MIPTGWSECSTCGFRWRTGRTGAHSCVDALREELDVTNKLLAERERALKAIPECPEHGPCCVPYALEWIGRARAAMEALPADGVDRARASLRETVDVPGPAP